MGSPSEIKEGANARVGLMNNMVKEANAAKNGAKKDKSKIASLYFKANLKVVDQAALNEWTESFTIPADSGETCKVRASREDYTYKNGRGQDIHKHDFIVFYLSGDCAGDEDVKIKFQRSPKSWTSMMISDGAEIHSQTDRIREFTLKTDGTTDRVAFRINKKTKNFKPRTPRMTNNDFTDLDLE